MKLKKCFKCGRRKELHEFYRHVMMRDGHLNKCIECTKHDTRIHYMCSRESRASYERERFKRPERKAKVLEYQRRLRKRDPLKYKARNAVSNALRDGKLIRLPCEICGERAQAHHVDYARPLEVKWLCFRHHRELEHRQVVNQ